MTTIDFILIILLLFFIANGFWLGFVHMLGSIVGLVIGIFTASRLTEKVSVWILSSLNTGPVATRIVIFILLAIIATRLVGYLFGLFGKTIKKIIPFFGLANRLVGAVLGLVEGALILGAALLVISQIPLDLIQKPITGSFIASKLLLIAKIVLPLFPKAIRELMS